MATRFTIRICLITTLAVGKYIEDLLRTVAQNSERIVAAKRTVT